MEISKTKRIVVIRTTVWPLFFTFFFTLAAHGVWKQDVQAIFNDEVQGIGAQASQFGLWIRHKDTIASLNENQSFIPASLSKIPTALAFLKHQPFSERFKTWVYHTGSLSDGVLEGDLYLKGGGDPTFVTESMWLLINKLKRDDLKEIKGQIYVDESYFDDDYYSKGRQQKRVDRAYDAPVSALSFNWNSLSIYVRPGPRSGAPARVYVEPELENIQIKNTAKTTSRSKTDLRVSRTFKDDKIVVEVKGEISSSKNEKAFYKSISNAALWTGENFKVLLNQAGIQYKGTVQKKKTPEKATMLVEYEGWSVPRVVSAMSKFSNNFVAEMLTKHLGKKGKAPGTIDDGLAQISGFLEAQGWTPGSFRFVNPSGFTRENQMQASQLGNLLYGARGNFKLAPEFLSALPISGVDGTLKSRMKHALKGRVRAKTGYMNGIVGLAGYMDSPEKGGEPLTFVFLYNGPAKQDWNVRAMFGRLLWRIYQVK